MSVKSFDEFSTDRQQDWSPETREMYAAMERHFANRAGLAALRAEVERMRDEAGSRVPDPLDRPWDTRYATLTEVLDLIDKHAREGE